jgi:hypothetical protein
VFGISPSNLPVAPRVAECVAGGSVKLWATSTTWSFHVDTVARRAHAHRDCSSVSRRNGETRLPEMQKAVRRQDATEGLTRTSRRRMDRSLEGQSGYWTNSLHNQKRSAERRWKICGDRQIILDNRHRQSRGHARMYPRRKSNEGDINTWRVEGKSRKYSAGDEKEVSPVGGQECVEAI